MTLGMSVMNKRFKNSLPFFLSIMLLLGVYTSLSPSTHKEAILIFDDGWKNQLSTLPILNQYCFNATFGIITSKIDTGSLYLASSDIRNLANAGFEIASHSVTHRDLTTLTSAEVTQELVNSKQTLESIIGKTVKTFIYPYCVTTSEINSMTLTYYQAYRDATVNTPDLLGANRYVYFVGDENMQAFMQNVTKYQKNNLLALCYHQIGGTTPLANFASQMEWLHNNGYAVFSLWQYLAQS
jgi:peptidoglycan/xylan/chitin deacetylase (PgdA/CDA1 family)